MQTVEPIRNRQTIDAMKNTLLNNQLYKEHALLVLGFNTGLRISDILKLTWKQIENASYIIISEQKTNKSKKIRFSNKIQCILADLRTYFPDDIYLFQSMHSNSKVAKAWSRQHAYRIINQIAREHNIEDNIGTHTLRKSFGFHAYKSGVDLSTIQKIFNHSSQKITLQYIGITQDTIDDVYVNLDL